MIKFNSKPKDIFSNISSIIFDLDPDKFYSLEIKLKKSQRSLEQNRLLWHNIGLASKAMKQDTNTTYCNLLLQTEAKYEFIAISPNPEIVKQLEKQFRAIRFKQQMNSEKGKPMHVYQVFYGSSTFKVDEMTELLDRSFDLLAELGIYEERMM